LPAILAFLVAAGAASVLYVIHPSAVHEGLRPPPELARLVLQPGHPRVPDVGFAEADGKRELLASFRGRYVLVNLWAPWCAPCVRELPQLARLKSALPGLQVLAVNVGRENAAQTGAFLKSHNAGALSVYVDRDVALIRTFNTTGLPFSVLVDRGGHEIARALGPCEWDSPRAISYLRTLTGSPLRAAS